MANFHFLKIVGIGDGGNEIGMGKVHDRVIQAIPKGEIIACKTSCDYLITCGLCDWGGYALAVASYLLRMCSIHDRYQRRAIGFPPTDKERTSIKDALPWVEKVIIVCVISEYNICKLLSHFENGCEVKCVFPIHASQPLLLYSPVLNQCRSCLT